MNAPVSDTRPLAIDLFCGVGGMSLGFEQAGFKVVAAYDAEQRNVENYGSNFSDVTVLKQNLSRVTGDQLRSSSGLGRRSLDLLFGGPPCQGFSFGGKQQVDDPRNLLLYAFARLVRQLNPKYFVLENVRGLLSKRSRPVLTSFLRRVRLAGFEVVSPVLCLNAADFGVPQRRMRTFILGYRRYLRRPRYPKPHQLRDEVGRPYSPLVRDALGDLPNLLDEELHFEEDVYRGDLGEPSQYASLLRDSSESSLTGCLLTRHSATTVARFRAVAPGAQDPISRFYRLDPDDVAPTIRAGTDVAHGKHTAPRPIHPAQPRCITVREGARLQSFPDWLNFHPTRWHGFRQLGNSVPPLLARAVAEAVMTSLRKC